MTYYIKAILLNDCSYSNNALKLLEYHNIPHKIIYATHENKELLKTNEITTFPQIYLKRNNRNGHLLLGGYNDLNYFINEFKLNKYNNTNISIFMNKYKWSKIAVSNLINLLNK